jgi:hypothetical protein
MMDDVTGRPGEEPEPFSPFLRNTVGRYLVTKRADAAVDLFRQTFN